MTYYEELGLKPDATPEEIRSAYRSLVRLLHPDQQGDEHLRRLAEGQMRRLNAVHDTLTDPARRQQYDASLAQSRVLASIPHRQAPRRSSVCRDLGLVVAGIAIASLYWQVKVVPTQRKDTLRQGGPVPQQGADAANAATVTRTRRPPAIPERPARARADREQASPGHDAAMRAAAPESHAEPLVEPVEQMPAAEAVSLGTAAIQPPSPVLVERQPAGGAPRFAGTWVYVRPRIPPSEKSLYPAQYIEAVIVEESGVLRGRYRARYEVTDRPISAEVAFRFEGRADDDLASLRWTGAGGAEGDLKLKLLSRDSMQLDWIATALGTQLGLASGTAVLVRRQPP
jgi:hypothetical protein